MKKNFVSVIRLLVCGALIVLSESSYAFTSIAIINGHSTASIWAAWNYSTQKAADQAALEGCRSEARKNGIGNLSKQCKVVTRAKKSGYGALTCGDTGCSWAVEYGSAQDAVDSAYESCAERYNNCRDKDITYWEDFTGFSPKTRAKALVPNDCRPRTPTLSCKSTCTNGNCLVTYENGCKMRVQVTPQFNPFSNQWTYPSPSC